MSVDCCQSRGVKIREPEQFDQIDAKKAELNNLVQMFETINTTDN